MTPDCRCGHAARFHVAGDAGSCLVSDCDCMAYSSVVFVTHQMTVAFPAPDPEVDRLIRQGAQAIQAGLNLQIRENRRLKRKRPLNVLSDAEREIAHCVALALNGSRMP